MIDSWTKKSANGRTVILKIEGDRKSGFVAGIVVETGEGIQRQETARASGDCVCELPPEPGATYHVGPD